MKKLNKSKQGFTLVEIVIVVSVIVILAGATFFSVTEYIGSARNTSEKAASHNSATDAAWDEVNGILPSEPTEVQDDSSDKPRGVDIKDGIWIVHYDDGSTLSGRYTGDFDISHYRRSYLETHAEEMGFGG